MLVRRMVLLVGMMMGALVMGAEDGSNNAGGRKLRVKLLRDLQAGAGATAAPAAGGAAVPATLPAATTTNGTGEASPKTTTGPKTLYRQVRVEYTFPEQVVSLKAAEYNGNNWAKAYAAMPCQDCHVTDAGAYMEYKVQRRSQLAFLTGEQLQRLVDKCGVPQLATSACWNAAGLANVKQEDYPYGTYAYKPPTGQTVLNGTYIILNADQGGPLDISYGMMYYGLDTESATEPGGAVVPSGGSVAGTRLKEVVQSLVKPVTLKAATKQDGGGEAWTRQALAVGSTYSPENGLVWWSNFNAQFNAGNGQPAKVAFLSGALFDALRTACPTDVDGILVIKASCWAQAGLNANPSTQLADYRSGESRQRAYADTKTPDEGGSCNNGWWIIMNADEKADMQINSVSANFGLRTPGGTPRAL